MKKLKKLLKIIGPGFITGASDDDPAGIATYSQTGAMFGYSQLWTALFSFPLMSAVQEMCGRIGLVTGKGLAGVIKKHYSKKILYPAVILLFIANTINIGADLGAMAAAANLVSKQNYYLWLVVIAALTLGLEIFVSYKSYSKYLKYFALSLLAYIATAFVVKIDWYKALTATIVPYIKFDKEYLFNFVAILGTSISPYLFFWQASEEVEEEVEHKRLRQMGAGNPKVYKKDIENLRIDTLVGMLFSQIVMWFIIAVTAATLYSHGVHNIESAQQAAEALKPLAGDFAFLLFAVGIIGTGLLAIPVLAGSASYAVSETFGWQEGLYKKFTRAKGFYSVIGIATIVGMITNFFGLHPMSALYWSAVLNGIIAPPLLILIVMIANNGEIMKRRTNNLSSNLLGILTIIVMGSTAIALLFNLGK